LCYEFLSPSKIHCPQPGLNPLILGPIEKMITTRPPWRTELEITWDNNEAVKYRRFYCVKSIFKN
jgi:hypothetical protein